MEFEDFTAPQPETIDSLMEAYVEFSAFLQETGQEPMTLEECIASEWGMIPIPQSNESK